MHLLLVPGSTKQLSEFMHYVNSNVARKVGRLHGWKERFWARRYSAIVVTDEEEAQVARLKYVLSQGVKEGLVKRPEEWPGLQVASSLARGYDEVSGGMWHDRTAQYRAARRLGSAANLRAGDFIERGLSFRLESLPCWRHLAWAARREAVVELVEEIVAEARIERNGRPVLGAKAVLRQDPTTAPRRVDRRYAPPCHAASRRARRELLAELRAFDDAFLKASDALRNGRTPYFPGGCFPPGLPYVAEEGLPSG